MADDPNKKFSWDNIDPELARFIRDTEVEGPVSGGFPVPEEVLRNRREWAKTLKSPIDPITNAPAGEQASDQPQGPQSGDKDGPERLIGPRNPDHSQVNQKPGGRDPD